MQIKDGKRKMETPLFYHVKRKKESLPHRAYKRSLLSASHINMSFELGSSALMRQLLNVSYHFSNHGVYQCGSASAVK